MTNEQKIISAMEQLPEEMTVDEFEALLCAIVNMHVAHEDMPSFFEYMASKLRMIAHLEMLHAEKETKH